MDVAINGFGGVTLYSGKPTSTSKLLEYIGLKKIDEEGDIIRFKGEELYWYVCIDVKMSLMKSGRRGVGTVHHISWRTEIDVD